MKTIVRLAVVLACALTASFGARAQQPPYDLLIRGGRIVDGTRQPVVHRRRRRSAAIASPPSAG